MTNLEKKLLIDSLDALWGVCDAVDSMMEERMDSNDARAIQSRKALMKAQDSISSLREMLGVE